MEKEREKKRGMGEKKFPEIFPRFFGKVFGNGRCERGSNSQNFTNVNFTENPKMF